jgi:hypothetical protein
MLHVLKTAGREPLSRITRKAILDVGAIVALQRHHKPRIS